MGEGEGVLRGILFCFGVGGVGAAGSDGVLIIL